MKKIQLCFLATLLLGAAACKKSSTSVSGSVSASDAADIVAGSLSRNSNGFTTVSDDVSVRSQADIDAKLTCGSTRTDTSSLTSPAGATITYSYGFGYSYTLNCNTSNLPDNVTGRLNYSGSFSGPNLSSSNTGNATFTLAGLTTTATAYVFNGSFLRSGSFASKTDTAAHGSSNLDIEVSNLMLHKPDRTIESGTATF